MPLPSGYEITNNDCTVPSPAERSTGPSTVATITTQYFSFLFYSPVLGKYCFLLF